MKIKDLSAPVTAAKADWLVGTTWLGFTPSEDTLDSRNQCESTILKQFKNGYIIEYITQKFSKPNKGFENDPIYLADKAEHESVRGRFVAVHKLRTVREPLEHIIGIEGYNRLQDMWAQEGKRCRWSIAFPIIESYEIIGKPNAEDVLGTENYRKLFRHASATLRPIDGHIRFLIGELEIRQLSTANAWINIDEDIKIIDVESKKGLNKNTNLLRRDFKSLEQDVDLCKKEGMLVEQLVKVKKRSYWLANKFILKRLNERKVICDHCGFDPSDLATTLSVHKRSFFDIHHKDPLAEGVRLTSINDFALLCPTCHRIEHIKLRS